MRARFGVTVSDDSNRTFAGAGLGHGRADALGAAGNNDDFIFQVQVHGAKSRFMRRFQVHSRNLEAPAYRKENNLLLLGIATVRIAKSRFMGGFQVHSRNREAPAHP